MEVLSAHEDSSATHPSSLARSSHPPTPRGRCRRVSRPRLRPPTLGSSSSSRTDATGGRIRNALRSSERSDTRYNLSGVLWPTSLVNILCYSPECVGGAFCEFRYSLRGFSFRPVLIYFWSPVCALTIESRRGNLPRLLTLLELLIRKYRRPKWPPPISIHTLDPAILW